MATTRWIGNATPVADLWTITLSGTVTSQTYTITINGKSISYTSTTDTIAQIIAALVAAWNASTAPEHMEYTAAGTTSPMTLTADTAGPVGTITLNTPGTATFSIAHTTSGTGPNDFANAANWSGGSAPANSDTLVFDYGSVPCKYNLGTSLTGITLSVEQGYSGSIGLPAVNTDNGNYPYAEYRTQYLTFNGGTSTVTINAPSVTRCNLAFGSNTANVQVLANGQRSDRFVPVVLLTGGNASSTLNISKGDVGVAFYRGTTARFDSIKTSFLTTPGSDVTLVCGTGATLATIAKNGGNLTINSGVTTLTQQPAGGTTAILAGAVTTAVIQGGTLIYNSTGTLGTLTVSGSGVVTFDQDTRAKTITNPIQVYGEKASVIDSQKAVNSGVLSVTTNQGLGFNVQHGAGNVCTFT